MSGPYVTLRDHLQLRYELGRYFIIVTKEITPSGPRAVDCLYGRIWTMIDPDDPILTSEFARIYPLTLTEVNLHCSDDADRHLHFEITRCDSSHIDFRIPLLARTDPHTQALFPGQRRKVTYSYDISERQWGAFCERRLMRATEFFSVRLIFPRDMVELSGSIISGATRSPLQPGTAFCIEHQSDVWTWSKHQPTWDDRYRFTWKFRDHREIQLLDDARQLIRKKHESDDAFHINEKDHVVHWNGKDYPVSPLQLGCITAIHLRTLQGHKLIHQKTILASVATRSARLRDIFKSHPLYGTLIKPKGNGYFSLIVEGAES